VLAAIPGVRQLALATVVVLRPLAGSDRLPSLSIVVPARDERGNIEAALERLPEFHGAEIEVIFVEGHSTDGTWEEIQRVVDRWSNRIPCRAYRQTGVGKVDAVRLGFSRARHELLTILDADLTMPPELLVRYYDAWRDGLADFVNGSRLIYPMEGEAMRALNHLGNVFFAKVLSAVLEIPISDSLCGSKLLSRRDYERMGRWRDDFGDFDPFGDFELLYPAATLALGTVEIAVRYRDRTYGETSIRRFAHGWQLLRMALIGLLRIRLGGG
jgi:glycosyltransferase involved in cell wall biosynthesis